jgi:hypothetical protein
MNWTSDVRRKKSTPDPKATSGCKVAEYTGLFQIGDLAMV